MACGVPVLCPRHSIHAERIEHGVDGLLYGSSAEARQLLSDLRQCANDGGSDWSCGS
jgi:hypothetical protein